MTPGFRDVLKLIAVLVILFVIGMLSGCASTADVFRARGDAYMQGWKDAVKQGARDV